MPINARQLKRDFATDRKRAEAELTECIRTKELKPDDFSIRDLAEATIEDGAEYVRLLDPRDAGLSLQEAGAVDTSAFSNITGQIVYSAIMEGYMNPTFNLTPLVRNIPTRLNGEKMPGMSRTGDEVEEVGEGKPYPEAGFGEDWIETPQTTKRGEIVSLTKEAVFFDRTGLILQRASEVGETLAYNKEKRIASVMVGAVNNYKWQGTAYDTYQAASPWINTHQNVLVDWSDLDKSQELFDEIVDPNTGDPIMSLGGTHIIHAPRLRATVRRVLNATEVRFGDGASASIATTGPTPVDTGYTVVESKILNQQLKAAATAKVPGLALSAANAGNNWIHCTPSKAFGYMENWPITVVKAPKDASKEFELDIVHRWKASERGVAVVLDPRYTVKNTH